MHSTSIIQYLQRCPTQEPRQPQRCMFLFRRGAEFGSDLYITNRTSGSKVQLDLQTQTSQIDSDQLPKHRGMLGSTKRGGEFQQHQTYGQSTSRSKKSLKTDRCCGIKEPNTTGLDVQLLTSAGHPTQCNSWVNEMFG